MYYKALYSTLYIILVQNNWDYKNSIIIYNENL